MINWLRKHHFLHDWGKWSDTKVLYEQERIYSPRIKSGMVTDIPTYFYQERYCKTCNKLDYRRSKQ